MVLIYYSLRYKIPARHPVSSKASTLMLSFISYDLPMRRVIGNRLAEVAVWNLIGRMVCKNVPSFFQSFFPYGFLGVADDDEELDDSPAFSFKTWRPEKLDIISLIPINFTIRLWNSEPTKGRSVWLANSLCFLRQSIVVWLILPLNVHLARADAGALDAVFVFLLLLLW